MMKSFFWVLSLTAVILSGCIPGGTDGLPKGKPPEMFLKIENETYETILGSYCWGNACVDKVGPSELLESQNPIEVRGGETISFSLNHNRKPNEFHLVQIQDGKETEIPIQSSHFTAPLEKGVYYYSYGVWWMDEKEENVSHGDAFYAFVLEVH